LKSTSQDGTLGSLPSVIKNNSIRLVTAVRKTLAGKKVAIFADFGLVNGIRIAKFSYRNASPGSIFARPDEEKKFETGVVVGLGTKIPVGKLKISPRLAYEYETPVRTEKFGATRNIGLVVAIGL
jgi:hypothetical protein